jgi:hypothetical protein
MKVTVATEKPETLVRLNLKKNTLNDCITVSDADQDWDIVSFKVVENKLYLVKHSGVEDENYATDKKGKIEETPE